MGAKLAKYGMRLGMPAAQNEIDEVESELGTQLPSDYKEFLLSTDGAEGKVGMRSYLALWSVKELMPRNAGYGVARFAPGLFLFGSDGGGEGYAFDLRKEALPVVMVPLAGLNLEDVEQVATSFTNLIDKIAS